MLRALVLSLSTLALGGCSVAPPQAYSFDPLHPQAKPLADPATVAPLTNEVAQLQLQLNTLRAEIAEQPDAWKRLALYEQENRIHERLGPLQRRLARYASAR